jgi:hypothetical protein
LRHAADDLRRHGRPVFGVAPTAKAAKVLRDETGIHADTVAKLLYEWRSGHEPSDVYRLPPGTTLVVDETGMVGTGALDDLVALAVAQRCRLALIGDPRQLQTVGRGGMFDELCRVGRTHKLATIHRFRHRWERAVSLQLRSGTLDAIDAYISHGRVSDGTFDDPPMGERSPSWLRRTSTSTPSIESSRSNAERTATSVRFPSVSQEAKRRPSAMSSSPAATTAPCVPVVANRCATVIGGTSSMSKPTAGSPCRTWADTDG